MVDAFIKALDELIDTDPTALRDAEIVETLHRQKARLEAVVTKATAAFDASGDYENDGAASAALWLSTRVHLPMSTAKRCVRIGRALRSMPVVDAAWCAGDIGEAQVAALVKVCTPQTADAFAADEADLVDGATRLKFGTLVRRLKYWEYRADPDGSERNADKQREGRKLFVSQSWEDMWNGDFLLDPLNGEIFYNELKRREQVFFDEDWAEARTRLGDDACEADLQRTPAQRRADALVEMAVRSASMPAGARRPEPLFVVLVGWETFNGMICQTARRRFVTPGTLADWLDEAWIQRMVFDAPSRVIDVGVRRRLFQGATREAVLVRDQECFHEYCETLAEDCQVDHIEPYSAGGLTIETNGRAACPRHNRNRHRRRR